VTSTAPLLEVSGLRTWFETERGVARAVDGVSFAIGEGETVGLVGESGCGKTVTGLSILGLVSAPGQVRPDSVIRFRGEDLVAASEKRRRSLRGSEISMVFQEPMTSLNPLHRVGRQIVEPLRWHRGLSRMEARREGLRLLEEVGIPGPDQRIDEYPHQLSGGMRQRVVIAMALACEPSLLLADEPTTALDVTIQAQILDLLGSLQARRRMGILLITHDLGVVAEACDRVIVMYAGQVVETGTVEQIFDEPVHPYTRGLLASVPRVGDRRARLRTIPGVVPTPTRWPPGCRFRDRCDQAVSRCAEEPPLRQLGSAGAAASGARCWFAGEDHGRAGETTPAEDP
jgi:peptide/nickel transport system ATP-binding protein